MNSCFQCKKNLSEKNIVRCELRKQDFCSLKCIMIKKSNINHKFKAKKCELDGIKFPSKLERDCYRVLCSLKEKGVILFFLRQASFDLPGGFMHKVDFQVFTQGNVLFIEAKGKDLAMGKMKREQVEDLYNIKIHIAKSSFDIIQIIGKEGEQNRDAIP